MIEGFADQVAEVDPESSTGILLIYPQRSFCLGSELVLCQTAGADAETRFRIDRDGDRNGSDGTIGPPKDLNQSHIPDFQGATNISSLLHEPFRFLPTSTRP